MDALPPQGPIQGPEPIDPSDIPPDYPAPPPPVTGGDDLLTDPNVPVGPVDPQQRTLATSTEGTGASPEMEALDERSPMQRALDGVKARKHIVSNLLTALAVVAVIATVAAMLLSGPIGALVGVAALCTIVVLSNLLEKPLMNEMARYQQGVANEAMERARMPESRQDLQGPEQTALPERAGRVIEFDRSNFDRELGTLLVDEFGVSQEQADRLYTACEEYFGTHPVPEEMDAAAASQYKLDCYLSIGEFVPQGEDPLEAFDNFVTALLQPPETD